MNLEKSGVEHSPNFALSGMSGSHGLRLLGLLGMFFFPHMHAQESPTPDKSGYTLFKPTPKEAMRELSTDRPDQTESPYTVDAGHFQFEMDFLTYAWDRDRSGGGDVRTKDLSVVPLNLKFGLLNQVDLQVIVAPYVWSKTEDRVAGTLDKASGFGDLTTRLKINFWGNDGGPTAFAVMPFVKWPLPASGVRNGDTEGGVIFVLGFPLPASWTATVMTEVDSVSSGFGGRHAEFVNSISCGRDLTPKLGGYVEFYTVTSGARGFTWQGQLDIGLTYLVAPNTQFDVGCNFGVTKSAPDYQPFLGFTFRY